MLSLRDERGSTLVIALGVMTVLAIAAGSTIAYTAANRRHADRSEAQRAALHLAEAGVNNAASVLGHEDVMALDADVLTPADTNPYCPDNTNRCFVQSYVGGETMWYGVLDTGTNTWTITSWGIVANPSPSLPEIQRQLSATIRIVADPTQPNNATAWNFVVASKTSDSVTCDMTMQNTAAIDAPLYVAGNLCLKNQAKVYEPDAGKPVDLIVKGKLSFENEASVGESVSQPITSATVVGGCTTTGIGTAAHPCTPGSPSFDPLWADTLTSSTSVTVTHPVVDWEGWYENANPGPRHACDPPSSAPVFDNDGTLNFASYPNGSLSSAVDLTPTSSYSCQGRDGAGAIVGEIAWDNATKVLTVNGVVYIDGPATVTQSASYNGFGVIYLSGSFSMQNLAKLCALLVSGNCDWANWDPNDEMLVISAHGDAGSGVGIDLSNSTQIQAGLFAVHAVSFQNSVIAEGPMIGSTIEIENTVELMPLPEIEELPLGAPGNPNTHASPQRPVYTG